MGRFKINRAVWLTTLLAGLSIYTIKGAYGEWREFREGTRVAQENRALIIGLTTELRETRASLAEFQIELVATRRVNKLLLDKMNGRDR